jgi:monoamine oxidase
MAVVCLIVVCFVILVAIVASITSRQYEADIPPIGYEQYSFQGANHSVLIVGAGAAGIFAGYALQFVGMENVQILEARSEFGGRTQQLEDYDVPLDLGAEWIHVQPNVLERLLLPFDDDGSSDIPLPATIRYRPQTIGVRTYDTVSRRDWFRWFYAETKFYNSTWWSYLADYVVQPHLQDKIQLNTPVQLIDYTSGDKIRVVTTTGKEFFADTVVVATPVNILQDEAIVFDPPVPQEKKGAWNAIYVTEGLKVWLEFSHRFYPDLLVPGGRISYWFWEDRLYFDALFGKDDLTDRHVLALFEVEPTAESKVVLQYEELVQLLLKELDDMYQGQASQYFLRSHVQNWSQEPYIEGAYSYNWDEYRDQKEALRKPIDGRIYFCGEYLADEDASVHGAAISGRNVVRQILKDLKSPTK